MIDRVNKKKTFFSTFFECQRVFNNTSMECPPWILENVSDVHEFVFIIECTIEDFRSWDNRRSISYRKVAFLKVNICWIAQWILVRVFCQLSFNNGDSGAPSFEESSVCFSAIWNIVLFTTKLEKWFFNRQFMSGVNLLSFW